MPSPRIVILYNEPVLPADHPEAESEREILDTVAIVANILSESGLRVGRLGVGRDLQTLLDGLAKQRIDAIFNLFEGLADRPFTETVVAGILEWHDLPFTGCPSETLTLARDKQRTKLLLAGAGLPTPAFFTVEKLPCPTTDLPWPLIVKPAANDASIGIDQASVVTNRRDLERRVAHVLEKYGPALVEQFIAGREFHVSVVDGEADATGVCPAIVLPLAEIVFQDASLWPIYSYDAKWAKESHEYKTTPMVSPVTLAQAQMEPIAELARRAYRLLSCRDYARVDVRLSANGEPYVLEVNPNPFLSSLALESGLEAIGKVHAQFIVDLAWSALSRRKQSRCPRRRRLTQLPTMLETP